MTSSSKRSSTAPKKAKKVKRERSPSPPRKPKKEKRRKAAGRADKAKIHKKGSKHDKSSARHSAGDLAKRHELQTKRWHKVELELSEADRWIKQVASPVGDATAKPRITEALCRRARSLPLPSGPRSSSSSHSAKAVADEDQRRAVPLYVFSVYIYIYIYISKMFGPMVLFFWGGGFWGVPWGEGLGQR